MDSDEQPENGGGEGVPGEPDETPGDSEDETETLPEDPEETPGIAGEISEDEEEISKEQEIVQTGDAGGEHFILLLISLSISGGILTARKRKQNKNGPEILAGLIPAVCSHCSGHTDRGGRLDAGCTL